MTEAPPHFRVAVIGSGFAGIGMAVRLKQAGLKDFVVLERAGGVGGTWRDNSYPGAACDVPSHLYSFSFAPNPHWSRSFSPQPEIHDYMERVAGEYGVREHVRTDHDMRSAHWEPEGNRWRIETSRGTVTAQFLVSAAGPLADPSYPDIKGLDTFEGTMFHSADWDHDHDLTGRRIAVIGTGASAIQFVPRIQPQAGRLTLFQRTAPWVMFRHDRDITRLERWLYRNVPLTQQIARKSIYWGRETYILGFAKNPRLLSVVEGLGRANIRRSVKDPGLRAKLTPDFRAGCKRILMSNDYYPALARPNVDVVTDGIAEVRPRAVVTRDASGRETEHEVDTIILGTGFHVSDPPVARRIFDAEGRSLSDHWGTDVQAFRGTTVAGFPNAFVLAGPNTGLGHTSQLFMIEAQIRYTMQALKYLCRNGLDRMDVRPKAQHDYNEMVARAMEGTVWVTGGCDSWYLNDQGRNTTLWPTFTWEFALRTRWFDPHNYDLRVDRSRGGARRHAVRAEAAPEGKRYERVR
ncbi:NAD(P)/FAD-dependent oxidoreductase [Nocardiopsis sp. HUAS JQ3]|uniref:flavin-containing monooxygenase n=1 Tax=Nocardiopsis sp. HUAS JQ3 TaxID=3061629 RepID=UPI0023A9D7C9|nr:NAD(P)/FAD-dependent oxidoreductase [Nocardiopsis sp. HUAS JQ3]WDZ92142.1 NAD(P)/FAD-dependent oxidoreductase [Nocardiopsis sp. HUAS JQ3]